jgi:hypothetical protein
MPWRERLFLWIGPGPLAGITIGDWLALLRENAFAVDLPYLWRAAVITVGSIGNSLGRRYEEVAYGRAVAGTEIEPPIFVLGIWRSGTTHLQNLLAVDSRFATANWYQVTYPHTFLSTEAVNSRLGDFFVPKRRLQDNMRHGFGLPGEDEMALCVSTPLSPWLSWVFPRRSDYYDRYVTLRGIPDTQVAEWKAALLSFVRKLACKYRKPLILKSPDHTARIRLLLDVFPEAKFVHIHRNPYAVFQSSRHTTQVLVPYFTLQRPTLDLEERTIRQYREVYDAFFEEVNLISRDHFYEVPFEDLERDPIGEMRRVYEAIGLPDFGVVESSMRSYVDSLSEYEKNTYPPLEPQMREQIAREWRRSFDAWGYPM